MSQHGVNKPFVTAHQNKLKPTVSGAIVIKYKGVSLQYYYSLYLFLITQQANHTLFVPYYITSTMTCLALPKILKLSHTS
jgi:hypothetical protein